MVVRAGVGGWDLGEGLNILPEQEILVPRRQALKAGEAHARP